jgi:hypothetical protein
MGVGQEMENGCLATELNTEAMFTARGVRSW